MIYNSSTVPYYVSDFRRLLSEKKTRRMHKLLMNSSLDREGVCTESIKVLMGCAPCQPFLTYFLRYTKQGPKDEKWKLLYYFRDLVKEILQGMKKYYDGKTYLKVVNS